MMAEYRQIAFQGRVTAILRLSDLTSFLVPAEGEPDDRFRENEDYLRYLSDVAKGVVVEEAEPEKVEPSNAERFDDAIERAQQALSSASTIAGVKAVFSATLDGLKSIYGTGGGS